MYIIMLMFIVGIIGVVIETISPGFIDLDNKDRSASTEEQITDPNLTADNLMSMYNNLSTDTQNRIFYYLATNFFHRNQDGTIELP